MVITHNTTLQVTTHFNIDLNFYQQYLKFKVNVKEMTSD